ncbi:uncharacterized protein [Drosophila tropicalis]|uniref:uncharacterized protein n=1 Tax=Drosophila tropicalis TaxID=46794 RepID=UPI0035AB8C27
MIRPLVQTLIAKEISELKVMGCASSTPMVATAGSEMLKAATHVAGDVKQQGEAVMEDATEALTTTMDTAKETVSTAVAGITNELGNAFKDGTQALDEAKQKVLDGLHLDSAEGGAQATGDDGMPEMSSSRAPTPQLVQADADSLKTSTPEPEIERALANQEESPPTPKPSLEELAQLSTQVEAPVDASTASEIISAPATDPPTVDASATTTAKTTTVEPRRQRRRRNEANQDEQRRPSTTEWEKFADQLAKSRKFKPYESFGHSQNQFSVYQDYTSMRDKPHHYDGHFSDGNSLSSASQSDLSSGHLTPAPVRRGQREFAKFVGSEQPASVSRASSRLSNASNARTFDFNPQRERISLPIGNRNRIGSGIQRAPAERITPWGRGKPVAAVAEEPEYGRRFSAGLIQHSLLPKVPNRGINESITPSKREKPPNSAMGQNTEARKNPRPTIEPIAKVEMESIRVDVEQSRAKSPRTPIRVEAKLEHKHRPVRPSAIEESQMVLRPTDDNQSTSNHDTPTAISHGKPKTILPQSPKQRSERHERNESLATSTTSRLPSPTPSRISSDSSVDVIIQPLSNLNTPSTKSLSPDQVIMTEYDNTDLEVALAKLELLRGSNATLHSLNSQQSCSDPRRHMSNTSSLLSSRRTSPWIMRKDYTANVKVAATAASTISTKPNGLTGSGMKTIGSTHKILERCDICCNEFVMQ